ncbi:uncharacterized protein fam83ga [Triplophysa rosa]|uniref:Scaffolding anchor of CK1 domain-containing protein n=1 Tax=Triplophysa rosa TaxID=992332 RepID=A0A9W7TUF3_TRIRA|nr:uncharacterized protein fam83ga [Triplophysa rosa]KAI7803757.1 putative protein FAM83G [Triplophysa rosa]
MALSQVQCLDDSHINLRTSESKPDFFYSEEQRLALETLIHEGRDAYEDHIKTNNIRCFLSDLELERFLNTVEVYSPGSPHDNAELYGESDGEDVSLQYWPDLSDYSIPQLDIGWPDWASYRGVTRVQVYTQPPYDGQPHIKAVVRKMIGQAQKVVAIVMDLFTDIDIFKDVLDASFRRKVAVYIILESAGVTHFLKMCDKAGIHTGHLKNLRVRSIRGAEFFSRSSKRVCGSQSQKFMFIDGDKAVSGSYSFTWSASRLDRNLITVLTGQTVEIFDSLFQDMYVMSNGVCLNKINLGSEPEPEILPQQGPTLFPTTNTAFKLINPKYTLVTGYTFTTNGPDQTNGKNDIAKNEKESVKHIIDAPALPPIHPGLLNLEKANMIHYVPTWPDPEPPSDVIGFINIRDANKPLQANLMRSELFEVSQAIRFKDSIREPKEPVMAHPISKPPCDSEAPAQTQACTEAQSRSEETERNVEYFDQNQQQESSQSEDLISPLQSPQPETVHVLTGNREDKEAADVMIIKNENIRTDSLDSISFDAKDDTASSEIEQILDTPQALQCPAQTPNNPDVKSISDSFESLNGKVIIDVDTEPVLAVDERQQNGCDTHTSKTDSNFSSLSDYYDCFSPLTDLRSESEVSIREIPSDLQSHNQKNIQQEREFPCLNSFTTQDTTDKMTLFTPKLLKTSCSIVFNFPPSKSNSFSPAPFKTTPVQESLNGEGAVTTSEEYFECSDTVGFGFDGNVMETSAQLKVNEFNRNEPHDTDEDSIPAVTLQIQKLTEKSMQEDDKHCDPELSCHNVTGSGSEKQSVMEMTVNGHLEANNPETVSRTNHDSLDQTDENIHRYHTHKPEVTQGPVVHTPEMILEIQPEELETEKTQSEFSLDLMCEGESVQTAEKTEKQLMLDLQPDLNLDLMCERQSVQTAEKTDKPQIQPEELRTEKSPRIDFQPEVNVLLMSEGECVKKIEEQLQLDLQPKLTLVLIREGRIVHTVEKTEKTLTRDLQPEVNLDLICEGESVKNAGKTEKPLMLDLQTKLTLDLICKEESIHTVEKTEKTLMRDLQSEVNLDLLCKGEPGNIAEKLSLTDFQPEVNVQLICEEESVRTAEKNEKPPILDSHFKIKNVICASILKHSELNGCESQSATDVESVGVSAVQDKAAVTPVIPENTTVTKSIDLHNSEGRQNLLADLEFESKHPLNLKSAEHVSELKPMNVAHSQTGLKENPEELSTIENHLHRPEDFETVELLILEDCDLQEIEEKGKNRSDPRKSKTALSAEAKLQKIKPAGLKTVDVRKLTENKFELYSNHAKQTCHLTAPVKKKERERVSAIQVKKNLPEAKPKLHCQVKKQPHQTSNRIPVAKEASGEISELHITKCSPRHPAPKAETHPPGQPPGHSNPCNTASPCPGEMTPLKSQQRYPWAVSSNGSIPTPKQPHVQSNKTKTTQSDQHVSRNLSASKTLCSSSSGTSFPRKIRNVKQTFKETPASKKKKE